MGPDETLRDLRAKENGGLQNNAVSMRRERINDEDADTDAAYRRSSNTSERTETSGVARRSTHNRQRTKLGADLFTAPLQRVEVESSQDRSSTYSSGRVTETSNTSERWMDNGQPSDNELTPEKCEHGEADDQPLADILAPPPEFCVGSSDLAESTDRNVSI